MSNVMCEYVRYVRGGHYCNLTIDIVAGSYIIDFSHCILESIVQGLFSVTSSITLSPRVRLTTACPCIFSITFEGRNDFRT